MTRITVDATTAAKLHGLAQHLEFCDEAGNVLGHFAPDDSSPAFRAWLRSQDPGLSKEEIERRISNRNGVSTAALVARLQGQAS
jgi:hypothetical protein